MANIYSPSHGFWETLEEHLVVPPGGCLVPEGCFMCGDLTGSFGPYEQSPAGQRYSIDPRLS